VSSAIVNAAFVNKLSGIGTGSPNRLLSALVGGTQPPPPPPGTPLAATVSCPGSRDYSNRVDCTATATGGTGTGYTFSWHGNASEYYDQGGTSKALVMCQVNYSGGYYSSGYLTAYGTVTDSSGQSVYFSTSRSC
jgi:hypothetical protein